jgi:hypothetical protein
MAYDGADNGLGFWGIYGISKNDIVLLAGNFYCCFVKLYDTLFLFDRISKILLSDRYIT